MNCACQKRTHSDLRRWRSRHDGGAGQCRTRGGWARNWRYSASHGRTRMGSPGLSELIVVDTMHERKAAMAKRAQCYIALPGGLGTLVRAVRIPLLGSAVLPRATAFFAQYARLFRPIALVYRSLYKPRFLQQRPIKPFLHPVADVNALWTHPLSPLRIKHKSHLLRSVAPAAICAPQAL